MSAASPADFGNLATKLLSQSHAALNFDFCPNANQWVYWLKNPFWILLAATVVAGLCGVFVNPYILGVSGGLFLVLLLGVVWPWIAIRGIRCSVRFLETRGREGQPTTVYVEITNRWITPIWGLHLTGGFGWETQHDRHGMALAAASGWAKTTISWRFTPSHRGVYPVEAVFIETGFPFGFIHARRNVDVQGEFTVWPRSVALDDLPDAFEIDYREAQTSPRRSGTAGDVLGSRLFRVGDSLRQVHWSQSARQGHLVVREREAPMACCVRLIVDLRASSHTGSGPEASLEQTLRVAASIVESLHRQHAVVECVLGRQIFTLGENLADLRRCLDQFAKTIVLNDQQSLPAASRLAVTQFVVTTAHGADSIPAAVSASRTIVTTNNLRNSNQERSDNVESVLTCLPLRWRRACHAG